VGGGGVGAAKKVLLKYENQILWRKIGKRLILYQNRYLPIKINIVTLSGVTFEMRIDSQVPTDDAIILLTHSDWMEDVTY
jgi:hypothetical protein